MSLKTRTRTSDGSWAPAINATSGATDVDAKRAVIESALAQRPDQFRTAKAFVDRLGAPVLAIPGNHDMALFNLWARMTRLYARCAAVFGADLEPVYTAHDLRTVGVNTTRAFAHLPTAFYYYFQNKTQKTPKPNIRLGARKLGSGPAFPHERLPRKA